MKSTTSSPPPPSIIIHKRISKKLGSGTRYDTIASMVQVCDFLIDNPQKDFSISEMMADLKFNYMPTWLYLKTLMRIGLVKVTRIRTGANMYQIAGWSNNG